MTFGTKNENKDLHQIGSGKLESRERKKIALDKLCTISFLLACIQHFPFEILQKYTVYRREIISGKEVDVRESSVLSGPNYLELSALQSNRRYDIWVKAETSAGYGASSDITSVILGHTGM